MTHSIVGRTFCIAGALTLGLAAPAFAQDRRKRRGHPPHPRRARAPTSIRAFPAPTAYDIGPLIEFERARGDELFDFEAPDDSMGFSLIDFGRLRVRPGGELGRRPQRGRRRRQPAQGQVQRRARRVRHGRAGRELPPARRSAQGRDRPQGLDRHRRRRFRHPRRRQLAVLDRPARDLEQQPLPRRLVRHLAAKPRSPADCRSTTRAAASRLMARPLRS